MRILCLGFVLILMGCSDAMNSMENKDSGPGSFATGCYRNLFVEAGYSPQEVTAKVNAVFQKYFYGHPEKQAIYFQAGENANGTLAYILDSFHKDIRSEGMSYGMMIAVQLDKKKEFDSLWNWAKTYMYHDSPAHPAYGYFSWSVRPDGTPNDEMPAPDGEEYIATALYFAAHRWGSGTGIYDYKTQADRLLTDMKNRPIITGDTVNGIRTAGNLFSPEHKMVRFSPVIEICDRTDPSYHLPAFYELWAMWGPKADREFWAQAASASREFFHKTTNPVTGLSPDYANFDGSPWASEQNNQAVHFVADAWRTSMNWSMDWAWWAKDQHQQQLSDRLLAFFESQNIVRYGSQFTLDGKVLNSDHSPGLVVVNAVMGLSATNPIAEQFVEAFWNTPVPTGKHRYYDGTLYMLAMLHCSGQFRIWGPQ